MKRKIFSLLMGLLLVAASYGQGGTIGSLTWYFDGETLTISGYGEMPSYETPSFFPWNGGANSYYIKNIVIEEGVKSIGVWAFGYCSNLTSVSIPSSVTSIGYAAFANCNSLTSITIPSNVTNIEGHAFHSTNWYNNQPDGIIYINKVLYGYKGIMPSNTTINILDGTISISGYAFYEHSGLTSITIPSSVISIGGSAFADCSSLTSITIPMSVTSIEYSTFHGCTNLTSIAIPESVTSIGGSAFEDCVSLTSITIPEGVTSIGEQAFTGCDSLTVLNFNAVYCNDPDYYSSGHIGWYNLQTVNIGSNVKHIPKRAFLGCSGLTSITIPEGVVSIGKYAFPESLTVLNFNATYCSDMDTRDLVPGHGWRNLQTVNIGSNVKNIPDYIFWECSNLTSITIPPSVIRIGSEAFNSRLTELNFNAEYCSYVGRHSISTFAPVNINIGSNVKHIPSGLFSSRSGFTSVILPDSLESIGDGAFSGCEDLQSIVIPDNVTYVGSNAFNYCPNLTYAYVGKKVETLGDYAFEGCEKLATVSLGESLEEIGVQAFASCPSLRNIYCYGETPADCAADAFGIDERERIITYTRAKLYYPNDGDAPALYFLLPVWRDFSKRSNFDADGKEVTVVPSTNTAQVILVPNVEATAYDIVVYSDASRTNAVCIISFDAEGRVTNITLRAGTDDLPFTCTVNNLKGGTKYYYTMTAYNNDDEIVEQKLGSFTTEGTSDIKESFASKTNVYGANGNIVIENVSGDISVYDTSGRLITCSKATGETVRIAVPQAGVYIVLTGRESRKVVVCQQ